MREVYTRQQEDEMDSIYRKLEELSGHITNMNDCFETSEILDYIGTNRMKADLALSSMYIDGYQSGYKKAISDFRKQTNTLADELHEWGGG